MASTMAVIMASSTIPRSIGKRRWGSTTTSYIYSLGSIVNPSGVNWNPGGGDVILKGEEPFGREEQRRCRNSSRDWGQLEVGSGWLGVARDGSGHAGTLAIGRGGGDLEGISGESRRFVRADKNHALLFI